MGWKYFARGAGMTAWWHKWFTAARAVMLGYNVMAIDAVRIVGRRRSGLGVSSCWVVPMPCPLSAAPLQDIIVLDDWYWRVKQVGLGCETQHGLCHQFRFRSATAIRSVRSKRHAPRPAQPPLSGFHLISQSECDNCINGGFSYIQASCCGLGCAAAFQMTEV